MSDDLKPVQVGKRLQVERPKGAHEPKAPLLPASLLQSTSVLIDLDTHEISHEYLYLTRNVALSCRCTELKVPQRAYIS